MGDFFKEVRRRNVHKVAIGYLATGWLITEVLGAALPAFHAPDWITKVVLLLFLIGLPFALWFSWAFEVTDEGVKRTHDVNPVDSITDRTGRRIDFAIIGMLVIAVGWLGSDKFLGDGGVPAQVVAHVTDIESIAVLPFEDFSEAGDQQHLAVGLADSILHMLAQVKGLHVAARTSSFSFEQGTDIRTVGDELNVGAVLEGSVQRSGDTLRIIAQLIRTSDQNHLWSRTFDRPAGEIFAIQDEIANEVVEALRPTGGGDKTRIHSESTSIDAFEHFSLGNALWQRRSLEDIEAAIAEFKAALKLDPDYAQAHAGLAMSYLFSTYYGARETSEVQLVVEQSIDRALSLDPENALAYAARGQLLSDSDRPDEAIAAYRRALQLNPNDAYLYIWLSNILVTSTDGLDEGLELVNRAYELDPRNVFVMGVYAAKIFEYEGDYDGALAIYRRSITLEPDSPRPYNNIATLHARVGRLDDAIRAHVAEIARAPESPGPYSNIANYFLMLEDQAAAQVWFDKAKARNPSLQYSFAWFSYPEYHDRLINEAEGVVAREDRSTRSLNDLVFKYALAGRDDAALILALELLTGDDGTLAPGDLDNFSAVMVAIWLLPVEDPRRQVLVDWLDEKIVRFASRGFETSGIYEVRAARAAFAGNREAAIKHMHAAIERGSRYFNEPWLAQYAGDPDYEATLADLKAIVTRQRNALRAEGL